ncbi:MAG: PilZ domain-containing protein [Desulfobulbaceae bacterium]|nr:PilZ domain-containing protein [Desulfobulbaceae bacterium]
MAKNQKSVNHRQSVRINERVLLSHAPVSPARYKAIADSYVKGIPPYNQEELIDVQMYVGAQNALNRLRDRDKDLAAFLQHLDTKVNLILKKMGSEDSPFDRLKFQEVNLSGTGIAFSSSKPMKEDEVVEFHVILLPEYTYVYCFGKVANVIEDKRSDGTPVYRIGTKFILLMEEDQEKLVQHNFKQQSLHLRNRRRDKR